MRLALQSIEDQATACLSARGDADAAEIGWACAWLEACGYSGLKMLIEALADDRRDADLVRDAIGLDLANVSCAFLAPRVARNVAAHGRVFLRNVRHGLYMLPFTVRADIGIGCPVDPCFAVGGERSKNPYGEKLELARAHGIEVDDQLWQLLEATPR